MGLRYNPPPGWPPAPAGFTPEPGWQPDPSWPPPPPGWQLWVSDDQPSAAAAPPWAPPKKSFPGQQDYGAASPRDPVGVYLTGGSYDDDSLYSSPVGTEPGDFGTAAQSDDSDQPVSQPGDSYSTATASHDNLASQSSDSYSPPAPSHETMASHPGDPYSASPDQLASHAGDPYATETSHEREAGYSGDPYAATASRERQAGHSSDPYAATASRDVPPGNQGDGFGTAGINHAGPGTPDGQYPGTWTPGGPAASYDGGQRPLPGSQTNGWAFASLVVGICCGAVIGAVLGVIALGKIRKTGQRGNLQAACGIVLSAFWTFVLIVIIVVVNSFPGSATRGANGQISQSGKLNVFSLAVGDCFDNPTSQQDIASVSAVPCSQPHNAQVFATFDLPGGDSNYPSNLTQLASNGCNAKQDRLNQALVTDSMSIRFIYPVLHAWQSGERTVNCLVVTPANVSSSLLNR